MKKVILAALLSTIFFLTACDSVLVDSDGDPATPNTSGNVRSIYSNGGNIKYTFQNCIRDTVKADNVFCSFEALVLSDSDQEDYYIYPYLVMGDGSEIKMQGGKFATGDWKDGSGWGYTFRSNTPTLVSLRFTVPTTYTTIKYFDMATGDDVKRFDNITIQ